MQNRADQRKFHYIYKITRNDGSGKYYIGMHSTDDLEDGYFGSGKLLWKSINKHGKEVHSKEILEFLPSRAELRAREKELITEEIVNDPKCMNLQLGGGGGFLDEEHKFKCSSSGGNSSHKKGVALFSVSAKQKAIKTRQEQFAAGNGWGCFTDKELHKIAVRASQSTEAKTKRLDTLKKIEHQKGEKNSQYGMMWIFNVKLKQCKRISNNAPIPDGWNKGRKMKFA